MKLGEKLNNFLDPCNFCNMEMNNVQMNNVIIEVNMDGVESDRSTMEGYTDHPEVGLEELILAANS